MKKIIFLLVILVTTNVFSQTQGFRVKLHNRADIKKLTKLCSIEGKDENGYYKIFVNESNLNEVKRLAAYVSEPIIKPAVIFKTAKTLNDFVTNWDGYPKYSVYKEFLSSLKNDSRKLIEIDTIGLSTKKRYLEYIHFKNNSGKPKTQVSLSSSMHGDELTGYVLMCRLAYYLNSMYGTESVEGQRVTRILDSLDLWIMPLNNPDGTYLKTDTSVVSCQRENANGVDLNRDFPDQFIDPNNNTTGREEETKYMMNFIQNKHFALSANFHTGAVVVNYPWDGQDDGSDKAGINNCPDSVYFIKLSRIYADANTDMRSSTDFANGITNGSDWYTIYGGRQDWIYVYNQGREVTIELSNDDLLSSTELQRQWTINKESLLLFLEQAGKGIHGLVRDDSGHSLAANIKLLEIPEPDVKTDSTNGYFVRLTSPGIYNIEVTCPGYVTQIIKNVDLKTMDYRFIEVTMSKVKSEVKNETKNELVSFNSGTFIFDEQIKGASVEVYNMIGDAVVNMNKEENVNYLKFKTFDQLVPGVYFVVVNSGINLYSLKIIK